MSDHRAFNHSLAAELSPCLAALAALFSSPTSADFFYPNDQKVIIDVLTARHPRPRNLVGIDAKAAGLVARLPTELRTPILKQVL